MSATAATPAGDAKNDVKGTPKKAEEGEKRAAGEGEGEAVEDIECEEDHCLVCGDLRRWWGVWNRCGHGVCWRCALRIRYVRPDDPKSLLCCICQTVSDVDGITIKGKNEPITKEERDARGYVKDETGWQVWYQTKAMRQEVEYLRGFYCLLWGDCGIETAFGSMKELQKHLDDKHNKTLCNVCCSGNPKFISEQTVYTFSQLKQHEHPHSHCTKDERSFPGHPLCFFCNVLLYDEDALYMHMREQHILCDICEALPDAPKMTFFKNQRLFNDHLHDAHHVCRLCEREYQELYKRRLTPERHPTEWTFASELDLLKHNRIEHPHLDSSATLGSAVKDMFYQGGKGGKGGKGGRKGGNRGEAATATTTSDASQSTIVITFDFGRGKGVKRTTIGQMPVARETRTKHHKSYEALELKLQELEFGEAAVQAAKKFVEGELRPVEFYNLLKACVGGDRGAVADEHIAEVVECVPVAERREALRLAHNMSTDRERGEGQGETMRNFTRAALDNTEFPTLNNEGGAGGGDDGDDAKDGTPGGKGGGARKWGARGSNGTAAQRLAASVARTAPRNPTPLADLVADEAAFPTLGAAAASSTASGGKQQKQKQKQKQPPQQPQPQPQKKPASTHHDPRGVWGRPAASSSSSSSAPASAAAAAAAKSPQKPTPAPEPAPAPAPAPKPAPKRVPDGRDQNEFPTLGGAGGGAKRPMGRWGK